MKDKKTLNFSLFGRLVAYAKPYKSYFFIAVCCIIPLSLLGPLRPYLIGQMVERYIDLKTGEKNETMLLYWALAIFGILMLEGVLQLFSSYFSNLLAQSVIRDLRKKIFQHLLSFRMRYFDKTPIGSIVTRVVSDLEAITEVFSSGIMEISGDLISLIVILSLMFFTNWQLSLMTLIPIPILIFATRIFAKAMKESFQLERTQVNKLNTFVQERLTGMSIVQLFNRQDQEFEKFEEINKGHRQAHINAIWANSIFFPVVELLSSLSIAFLLVWVALTVEGKSGTIVQGQVFSFTLWIHQLYRPIRQLADKFNILQRGTVRAERIFEVLDQEDNVQETGKIYHYDFNKDIHFKNVFFAYNDEDYVLKGIDLTINRGETVAFVGATGAGKSTIVNLLGRFYEFQKGEILIGDTNINDIELNYLRSNIAIVLQDVFLFSDTIHNNITLGDRSISREKVIDASKAVGAHEFISKLPNGYDYEIGERGGVLSVGQRQLLAFIRAYVYNPHILILDEATSSVDNESEELIQNATEKLTNGRTSIVIAHRLSTIQKADRIVVLDKGKIIESGSHFELIQKRGYYYKLYEMQFFNKTEGNETI